MDKIKNYIRYGRGTGAFLIFVLAFVTALYYSISAKITLTASIPYIQEMLDDILPIEIKDGRVITPQNTIKEINLLGQDTSKNFPFIIDTTRDKLPTEKLTEGIYLSRSYLYTVSSTQVKSVKLTDSFQLPRQDYTDSMKTSVVWFTLIAAAAGTIIFFLIYFMLVVIYAFCSGFSATITGKTLGFDTKLRLNSVLFILVCLISFILKIASINLTLPVFFLIMIALQIITLKTLFK